MRSIASQSCQKVCTAASEGSKPTASSAVPAYLAELKSTKVSARVPASCRERSTRGGEKWVWAEMGEKAGRRQTEGKSASRDTSTAMRRPAQLHTSSRSSEAPASAPATPDAMPSRLPTKAASLAARSASAAASGNSRSSWRRRQASSSSAHSAASRTHGAGNALPPALHCRKRGKSARQAGTSGTGQAHPVHSPLPWPVAPLRPAAAPAQPSPREAWLAPRTPPPPRQRRRSAPAGRAAEPGQPEHQRAPEARDAWEASKERPSKLPPRRRGSTSIRFAQQEGCPEPARTDRLVLS